ncbi:MAG: DUF2867 domain-containing protein [Chloroflexota bacterium]
MPKYTPLLTEIPEVATIIKAADHIDVKTIEGNLPMRTFIAGMLSYQPAWMTFLYRVRGMFVRLLGMKQNGVPVAHQLNADDISLTPGDAAAFFTVKAAQEEAYWFVGATESHLTAHLGVIVEPLAAQQRRFHVVTVVHYHRWTGPVYFNVIRPFHHLVVHRMMQAGIKQNDHFHTFQTV